MIRTKQISKQISKSNQTSKKFVKKNTNFIFYVIFDFFRKRSVEISSKKKNIDVQKINLYISF